MSQLVKQQEQISEYIMNILQEVFGKKPDGVYVTFKHTFISIYIRNFISPSERVLIEQDQELIAYQMREKLMLTLLPEIKSYIQVITGVKLREMYHDWNFQNKTGMFGGISSIPFTDEIGEEKFEGKRELDFEVIKISQQAEKVPEELYSCKLDERTIVVVRNGILVRIEKEFIRLGYQDTLKSVKRNLEKSYLHNSSHLEDYLNMRIIDVFVDWDFHLDKSLAVFIVHPKELMGRGDLEKADIE